MLIFLCSLLSGAAIWGLGLLTGMAKDIKAIKNEVTAVGVKVLNLESRVTRLEQIHDHRNNDL